MVVTGVPPEFREELLAQIGKICSSDGLRSSESLCHLLTYLARHAIREPGSSAKEYQIATEVLGRPADFDPRLDSTVRVQTGRLRAKLAEYYAGPGAEDPIIVEVPRGSYSVAVHPRALPAPPAAPAPAPAAPEPSAPGLPIREKRYGNAGLLLSFACFGLLAALLYVVLAYVVPVHRTATGARTSGPGPSLSRFWEPFVTGPERTWVVFSNAEFVGRPETGMRYLRAERDKGAVILDHYTGTGEVMAIHEIDRLFAQFGHAVFVKRGRLLNLDDVKNNDVVFVGSPSENLTLRDLPPARNFEFGREPGGNPESALRILNLHPAAGEQPAYFASPGLPITQDYAVIGLMPGPDGAHWVMTLAGISTIGTQAAVEYVCNEASVTQLVRRAALPGGKLQPFEALIRVTISRGVPVSGELVAFHPRV